LLLNPAITYAANQWSVQTPVLGLPDTYRAAAMPVGMVMMMVAALLRLARFALRDVAVAVGVLAVIAAGPYLAAPPIIAMGNGNLVVFFVVLLAAGVAMGIGLFAPPFGLGYYAASLIARINPDEGLRRIWHYLAALSAGLALIAAVPWISTGFLN